MPQLPMNIDMQDRSILVVGGGQVACRKVKALLAAGASVRVVSPAAAPAIAQLAEAGTIDLREGRYESSDLSGVFLAVAATDNAEVNRRIASEAKSRGILVAVGDAPELGNCTFPAVLRRGNLEIGVATGGRCPAFAVGIRDILAGVIGEEYGAALEHLAVEREKLLTEGNDSTYNAEIVKSLAERLIADLSEHKESS